MLYLICIFISMSLIATFNCLPVGAYSVGYIVFIDISSTIAVILIDATVAVIIRYIFPLSLFDADKMILSASKNEKKLLEKLGIKKWKDKVPELGGFSSFHKDRIYNPKSVEYLKRFVAESNVGIICHVLGGLLGFSILLFRPFSMLLSVCLPVVIINLLLNALPAEVLRYNLYKLRKLVELYHC